MTHSHSVRQAIGWGLLVVNGPVLLLLTGPIALFALLIERRILSQTDTWVGVLVFVASFVVAWLWWSVSVPRWRIWAYERVNDIPSLKKQAVVAGLTWPEGHTFAKTELKSKAQAQRERELDPPA
jgi:hypothetical protein